MTTLVVEGGVWSVFWQRLAQVLHVDNNTADSSLHGVDDEAADVVPSSVATVQPPDWSLLSFKGLSTALNIAIAVFIKVSDFTRVAYYLALIEKKRKEEKDEMVWTFRTKR